MNLIIRPSVRRARSRTCPLKKSRSFQSGIRVTDAGPVVVAVNSCACDLVELIELLAADLADLAIIHLDLAVIA
jgi:hypothetical protein